MINGLNILLYQCSIFPYDCLKTKMPIYTDIELFPKIYSFVKIQNTGIQKNGFIPSNESNKKLRSLGMSRYS